MARIRTIHPDTHTDPKLARASDFAWRVYWSFAAYADDHGWAADDPERLQLRAFPTRPEADVTTALAELVNVGKLARFEDADSGGRYFRFVDWKSEQRVDKPAASKIGVLAGLRAVSLDTRKAPESPRHVATIRESSRGLAVEGKGEEGSGEETKSNYLPASPDGAPGGRTPAATPPAAPAPVMATPPAPARTAPPVEAPPALALVSPDPETPPARTRKASARQSAPAAKVPEKWPGFAKADCDTLYEAWTAFGVVNYGRFRNTFGPLFPEAGPRYPVDRLVKAIKEAVEEAKSKGGYDLRMLTPDAFVSRVGYWIEQAAMPVVDDWGNPTARGIRYGMIA